MHDDDPIPALKRQLGDAVAAASAKWSLGEAASLMRTDRWRVADIRAGRLGRFSLDTLIRFAHGLGCDVSISADARPRNVAGQTNRATGSPQR